MFIYINNIFNNNLFKTPHIKKEELLENALNTISETLSQTSASGQLSLFDFQFDIIPIEFISHIYQIFLDDEKIDGGIYYTPEGLVNLIVDKTITQNDGKILDCACGSGIFLILGFRKMFKEVDDEKILIN